MKAHPDGAQAEDRHLEAEPVPQAAEDREFRILVIAGRVPAAGVRIAPCILFGNERLGEGPSLPRNAPPCTGFFVKIPQDPLLS